MGQPIDEDAWKAEIERRVAAAPKGTYAPRPRPGTVPKADEFPKFYLNGKGRAYATPEEAMEAGEGVVHVATPTGTRRMLPGDLTPRAREILREEAETKR